MISYTKMNAAKYRSLINSDVKDMSTTFGTERNGVYIFKSAGQLWLGNPYSASILTPKRMGQLKLQPNTIDLLHDSESGTAFFLQLDGTVREYDINLEEILTSVSTSDLLLIDQTKHYFTLDTRDMVVRNIPLPGGDELKVDEAQWARAVHLLDPSHIGLNQRDKDRGTRPIAMVEITGPTTHRVIGIVMPITKM